MQTGYVISFSAHAALIGWVLFGGAFHSEPEPVTITEVAVISTSDFAALTAAPDVSTDVTLPAALPIPDALPDPVTPDPTPALNAPDPTETPDPEVLPEPPVLQPETEALDDVAVPVAPSSPVDLPNVSERPVPRPADRVAPDPVEAPNPDAQLDPLPQVAALPEPVEEALPEVETQEETAPEAAAPEIVTEAEDPAGAMTASVRPPARRPSPPRPTAEPTPTPEPEPEVDAVAAAIQDALAPDQAPAPVGPPLSAGEKDALRVAVQQCWNVGSLSSEALMTTVVVAVSMAQDGRPQSNTIRMLTYDGGSQAAARQAFEAARRAILRCGARGFDLPADKYAHWKDIEMTFNPERMRIR